MPVIELTKPVKGEDAKLLQSCFPEGVIEIKKNGQAAVKDARRDTVSREVLRHANLKDKVKLGRRADHFIFNVESTGQYSEPYDIVIDAAKVLKSKALALKQMVDQLRSSEMVIDQ